MQWLWAHVLGEGI